MKYIALLLASISACPVFAESTGRDAFVSGVIGAASIVGLILIVGIYRLGKILVLKLKPTTSLRAQRVSGVMLVFAFFLLASAFGK